MDKKLIELYRELHDQGAFFFERSLPFADEEIKCAVVESGNAFALCMDTSKVETIAEETELIAHECGHIATGAMHKVYSPYDVIGKHERRADKWAVRKLIPRETLEDAVAHGYTEPWEIAEYLGRTEEFVRKAFELYEARSFVS